MNKQILKVLPVVVICLAIAGFMPAVAQTGEPSTPFIINGSVLTANSDPCNNPCVLITNLNTSVSWYAQNTSTSNHYLLVLNSTEVSTNPVLQFNASGCSQSNTVTRAVTQPDIDDGSIFGFEVTLGTSQEIIWQDGVTLINGTTFNVTAHNSGESYDINQTTALGALDAAAEAGEFNYTVSDEWYASWGSLFVDSIADIPNEGWDGWMYWVNYPEDPLPMVGADQYTLEDGDAVTWYWSSSMEMTPDDSPMLVIINVTVASGPDLTVTAIETPTRLRADVVNPITAVVENIGSADASGFDITLAADGTVVDTVSIAALNASEHTTVELLWTPTATGDCTLNVTADALDAVEENDETDNSLTEDVTVLEKLTATVNVRIEGKNDTVWTGTVTFSNSTVTTTDGATHYLNEPTALGALDEADKLGGFGYVLVDYGWGLYVSEVAGEPPIGWDGWMYRVDYNSPWVGAADFVLNVTTPPAVPHKDVLWYFGAWTAPPLKIELETTTVMTGETFVATVTAYNDSTAAFDTVDKAEVYVDGVLYGLTGTDGTLTMSLATAGSYQIHADKGTWAEYTRSEKVDLTVTSPFTTTYDFTTGAGSDKWAYRYQNNTKPPATNDVPDIEFIKNLDRPNKDQYVKISTDNRKMQSDSTNIIGNYAVHRFVFDITQPVEDIVKVEVLWNGKGAHTDRKKLAGATLYIWNGTSGAYEELANTTSNKEVYLTAEMTAEIGSYVDATGNMTVLVEQNSAQTVKGKRSLVSKLSTDYVKVDITHT